MHHCPDPECNGAIKTSCYEKLHVAFCLCLITQTNGHQVFCGHRFQAESPRACALHGWGVNDENRIFQRAKKGLSFELPELLPHEQPGWEMVLSSFGSIQYPVHIRMGLIDGELCFVRVVSSALDGQPDQVAEIARVKTKELLLTKIDPRDALKAHKAANEEAPATKAAQVPAETEQSHNEYDNPFSYHKYTTLNLDIAAASKLEQKKAKEARTAAQVAERAARSSRKRGQRAAMGMKHILKGKKKHV